MALFIYDQGYRTQAPKESLFPKGGVNTLIRSRHTHKSADIEDKVHAEGEKFVIPDREPSQSPANDSAQNATYNPTRAYTELAEGTSPKENSVPKLTVANIMVSPVHMVSPNTLAYKAWQRMESLEVSHLVVSEDDSHALGLLSKADLLEKGKESRNSIRTMYSSKLMAASPETSIQDVALGFIESDINSMPVIDQDDQVVGIVCRTDLLRLLISGPHLERWV